MIINQEYFVLFGLEDVRFCQRRVIISSACLLSIKITCVITPVMSRLSWERSEITHNEIDWDRRWCLHNKTMCMTLGRQLHWCQRVSSVMKTIYILIKIFFSLQGLTFQRCCINCLPIHFRFSMSFNFKAGPGSVMFPSSLMTEVWVEGEAGRCINDRDSST